MTDNDKFIYDLSANEDDKNRFIYDLSDKNDDRFIYDLNK